MATVQKSMGREARFAINSEVLRHQLLLRDRFVRLFQSSSRIEGEAATNFARVSCVGFPLRSGAVPFCAGPCFMTRFAIAIGCHYIRSALDFELNEAPPIVSTKVRL